MSARTLAAATNQLPHWSAFERRLERLAGPGVDVSTWLVDQLNLRGFVGASNREAVTSTVEPSLGLEELVVGLLRLTAPVEARLFKLVVRVLQSGKVSGQRLQLLARRERVDHVVYWLVGVVPAQERTTAFELVAKAFAAPPRGYRGMNYRYDALRLVRRPATRESLWHAKPR